MKWFNAILTVFGVAIIPKYIGRWTVVIGGGCERRLIQYGWRLGSARDLRRGPETAMDRLMRERR